MRIQFREPANAFRALAGDDHAVFLDSADGVGGRGRYSYIAANPAEILTVSPGDMGDPFEGLEDVLARHARAAHPGLPPFQGGAVGYLGYELGERLEVLPERKTGAPDFPDLWLGVFPTVAAFDLDTREAWVFADGETAARQFADRLASTPDQKTAAPEPLRWRADQDAAAVKGAVARAVDYIHAGDIFQANLAQRFTADLPAGVSFGALYEAFRDASPAPFGAFIGCGEGRAIMSTSPERFLSLSAAGAIETRPIKGTRPRGKTPAEDAALAAELLASAKDRAENLMIVDLLRNDLSRIAEPGSVSVPELFELERFSRVHHLVSEVRARLAPGLTAIDLLKATFPGGSVTGAPKIRAMEIIHELEPVPRGPYCGAILWVGFDGALDSSIVIRTLLAAGDKIMLHAGGGIVADSDPELEYEEMLTKAGPLLRALDPDWRERIGRSCGFT